jgi:hypothetical protein
MPNYWIGGIERYITQRAVAIYTLGWRLGVERETPVSSVRILGCTRQQSKWTVAATEHLSSWHRVWVIRELQPTNPLLHYSNTPFLHSYV